MGDLVNEQQKLESSGDLIVHLVKVFNNGTNSAYSSTTARQLALDQPLSYLRKYLVEKNVFDSRIARRRFCTKERSEVDDTIELDTYLQMAETGKEANVGKKTDKPAEGGKKTDKPAEGGKKTDKPAEGEAKAGPAAEGEANTGQPSEGEKNTNQPSEEEKEAPPPPKRQITVYISALTASPTGFDASKAPSIDLALNDKLSFKTAQFKTLQSQFDSSKWAAKAGSTQNIHPYEMNEEEWGLVIANNGLTCAHNIKTSDVSITPENAKDFGLESTTEKKTMKQIKSIERSWYPAFDIVPRHPDPYELFHKTGVKVTEAKKMAIPRIHVINESHVSVEDTKSEFEESMAKSSFSEDSYQGSAGGGAFGYTLSVSGGHSANQGKSNVNGVSRNKTSLHVIYKFPRVEVLLDQASLRPTDECLKDWNNTKGVNELKERFFDKYGTPNTQNWIEILKNSLDYPGRYFPTRIQLGGKLTTSQEHNAKDNVSIEEKKKAMRWSAGVSFNTPWGGASFNTSHGKQSGSLANTNDANMTGNMNWEACGGDTLLGNSPPDWCSTVGSFHNWRIIHQDNIVHLETLLPSLSDRSDKPICVTIMPLEGTQDNGNVVAKRIQSAKVGAYFMDGNGSLHPIWMENNNSM